jgi:dephospho-CoA kinase
LKIIGLTGGIGSGKTAVLDILSNEYGAYIIEADKLAHSLMEPGQSVYKAVVDYFGTDILGEDNYIDRKKLGAIVFSDEEKLKKLNSLSHPLVKEAILNQIEEQKELHTKLFVIEAALLIQDGYTDICDIMCYVYADLPVRIERLCKYRGFDKERAESVIASQDSEEFYREHCDYIIDNSGSMEDTRQQLLSLEILL